MSSVFFFFFFFFFPCFLKTSNFLINLHSFVFVLLYLLVFFCHLWMFEVCILSLSFIFPRHPFPLHRTFFFLRSSLFVVVFPLLSSVFFLYARCKKECQSLIKFCRFVYEIFFLPIVVNLFCFMLLTSFSMYQCLWRKEINKLELELYMALSCLRPSLLEVKFRPYLNNNILW